MSENFATWKQSRRATPYFKARRSFNIALLLLLLPFTASSAIAADVAALSSWTTGTAGPSRYTSGTDRLLVLTVGREANSDLTITSVTYGGRTMTQVVTADSASGAYARAYIFYLKDSDISSASSNNFAVNWTGTPSDVLYAARMYQNVDQSDPIRDFDSAATDTSTPNPIVTPNMTVGDGDMVVAAAFCGNANTYSWNNSFTEGTDQSGYSSQHTSAQRPATFDGSISASATNSNPNRQVIVGAVLRSTNVAAPTGYYVRTDGSNSNSGTGSSSSQAWRTLDYALGHSSVNAGDIIYVRTGTYTETVSPARDGNSSSPIQVIADTDGAVFGVGGAVTIQAPTDSVALSFNNDNYWEFYGFEITGSNTTTVVTLSNSYGAELYQCEISSGGFGFEINDSSSSLTLTNCLIHNTGDDGIHMYNGTATLLNCTIADGAGDGFEQDAGTSSIRNTIIVNNTFDGLDINGGSSSHTYNLVWGNGDLNFEGTSSNTGEISQDPQFSTGYQLSSSSPAVDAGTSSGAPSNDFDGNSRPDGSGYDMGCYEYIAVASTFYVRTDGSDTNSGTGISTSQAWRTLDYALGHSSVGAGAVIYVRSGTYTETVTPARDGTSGNPIQVIADTDGSIFGGSGGDVTIQAPTDSNAISFNNDDYWEFHGFTIAGSNSTAVISMSTSYDVKFSKCEITSGGYGVSVNDSSSSVTLENCILHNTGNDAIHVFNGSATVRNCTIADGLGDGFEQDAGSSTIRNTIIVNWLRDGIDLNGGTLSHSYNLVYGCTDLNFEGTSSSTGEISQDPQFSSGYELSSSSPAIDVGTSTGAPTDDFDGYARPIGSGYDMGAYEYSSFLLGHWKLDETSGTSASDSSGKGNDATLTGGVTFDTDSVSPAPRVNGLDFNGSGDYLQVANDSTLQPTSALTICAFVNGDSWSSGTEVNAILRKGDGNPNNYQLAIEDGYAALYLDGNDGSGIRGDTKLNNERWYHVAATWDGSYVRIYVDGQLDMTPVAYSGPIGTDTRTLYIGGRSGTEYFDGSLDDVRLYGAALSQEEIAEIYGLVGWWKLDETSGTTAADSSPSGLDGTYVGGPTLGETGPNNAVVAAQFDGSNDYVDLPIVSEGFGEGISMSLWAKPTSSAYWARFLALGNGAGADNLFLSRNGTSSMLSGSIVDGSLSGTQRVSLTGGITNDTWHHYVFTVDSSGFARLYIDGVQQASATIGTPSDVTRSNNYIGRSNYSADAYYQGQMYDVRLFSRAITVEEVETVYKSGLPKGLRIIKWVEVK